MYLLALLFSLYITHTSLKYRMCFLPAQSVGPYTNIFLLTVTSKFPIVVALLTAKNEHFKQSIDLFKIYKVYNYPCLTLLRQYFLS
jgi:hypothetical protein